MKYPATKFVHTPSGITACCDDHATKLINLMSFMGAHTVCTVLDPEQECQNCINEAKKRGE
jgi:hypothetical protein